MKGMLRLPSARARKLAVVAVFALLSFSSPITVQPILAEERPDATAQREQQKYREAAWSHFRKLCNENAGEKIYRTVENVEGIFLERPRTKPSEFDLRDQHWMGDPYGLVMYPPAEIARYLNFLDPKGIPTKRKTARQGFKYVITRQSDGKYLAHRLDPANENLVSTRAAMQPSRYAITWRDVSTDEDRKYWVAGGQLRIIDVVTADVLGERIGYVLDSGFGSTAGGRVPWLIARRNACPPIERNVAKDRLFVEQVLKPIGAGSDGK